ncbi:MAG: hypothetical protein BHV81_13945 [Butyricimonas synergistica]|nr:MAG: hypothetical protein BHV81_13945 [Butyricimonas synergistica]
MIPPFPNFFTIIFHLFFKPPTNTVTGKTLGRKNWQNVRKKKFYRENGKDHREKGGEGGKTGKRDHALARQAPFRDTRERL